MVKKVQLIILCYRYVVIPSLFITLILSYLFWDSHTMHFIFYALIGKVMTSGILMLYIFFFRSDQFYFFNNLGFSNSIIYLSMLVIDFAVAISSYVTIALLL